MTENKKLKRQLIESGRLTEDEIARAEDYALTTHLTLDDSIIFLKMLNYSSLGQCLAEISHKPYIPLLDKAPSEAARERVSLKTAETFWVFPLHYDGKKNSLTLAVTDPEAPHLMENLHKNIPASIEINVSVASKPEIRMALDVYYKGRSYTPEPELRLPKGFMIVTPEKAGKESLDFDEETKSGSRILLMEPDMERSRALISLLRREGFPNVQWASSVKEAVKIMEDEKVDKLLANGRIFRFQTDMLKQISRSIPPSMISFYNIRNLLLSQEYAYAQMSAAVLSLVTFIVRKALHDHDEVLAEIINAAKYCKLLAMRIGLPAIAVDATVLAAWLSAPVIGSHIREHFTSPYPLDEMLDRDDKTSGPPAMERLILSLVKKYLELKKKSPEIAGDMDQVRKHLLQLPDVMEDKALVEAFLNVLKDDEFLKDVGRSRRRILVVDPAYVPDSALVLRLKNDGYEVVGVPDARQAARIIFDDGTDLVISEVNLPETDGLKFCRALRKNSTSAHLPFFFVTSEEGQRMAAQCLEAGADDFFKKPVELEMLSIKIRNLLALTASRSAKRGISGTLKDMSFTDIIQSLTTGDKDVEIQLKTGRKKGLVFIQQGEVVYAEAQGLEGQEAFYRLMTWQDGEFEITAAQKFPKRNIYESAMSLLMEGARMADDDKELPDEDI